MTFQDMLIFLIDPALLSSVTFDDIKILETIHIAKTNKALNCRSDVDGPSAIYSLILHIM